VDYVQPHGPADDQFTYPENVEPFVKKLLQRQ
jgi:hypothetical protein